MGALNLKKERFLLDTHVLLWWFFNDNRLSKKARQIISNRDNAVLISSASAWEISTKGRLGKLPGSESLVKDLPELIRKARIEVLPITLRHALLAGSLVNDHRDPFDRMLAAQTLLEELSLLTSDKAFDDFPVRIVW
ncbi:MAG: type II toxin-antitoxin system VapC family toxin [Thermodesulfobacteriota bacterium]